MRLACVQLAIEGGDVAGNVSRALSAIGESADRGCDLVVLPELFDVGYFSFDSYARAAEGLDGDRLARLADCAAANDVALLAGTIVEDLADSADAGFDVPAESGLANTAVLFDRSGDRRLVYRKRHLFGYGSVERDRLVAGESLSTATIDGVRVSAATCYDMRFPEQFRALAGDVDLFLVPSAWPYPRVEHWRTLGRARAIENLAYVATVNGSGSFADATLCGRTTVYDPWGTTIASSDEDPRTVFADVDPDRVAAVREEFPALADRREDAPGRSG